MEKFHKKISKFINSNKVSSLNKRKFAEGCANILENNFPNEELPKYMREDSNNIKDDKHAAWLAFGQVWGFLVNARYFRRPIELAKKTKSDIKKLAAKLSEKDAA